MWEFYVKPVSSQKKKKNLRSSNTGPQFPWQQLVGNKQELPRWG